MWIPVAKDSTTNPLLELLKSQAAPSLPGPANNLPAPARAVIGLTPLGLPGKFGALMHADEQGAKALTGLLLLANARANPALRLFPDAPGSRMARQAAAGFDQSGGNPLARLVAANEGGARGNELAAFLLNAETDPLNAAGPAGKLAEAAKLGRVAEVLQAADRAQNLPGEALGKVAAPAMGKLLAGLADRQAAREALTKVIGNVPKAELPLVGGKRQFGPIRPPEQFGYARGNVPGGKRLGPPLLPSQDIPLPPELGPAFPERGNVPANQLIGRIGRNGGKGIGPPVPPGPRWQDYGPETIHPGEDVTPELLDRFARLRQFPNPSDLDVNAEIGAVRDPVTLLQDAYGDQWQNRLAALTGGKWGQPGSGARLVNGRVMLGDLDLTVPLRDYLETRGGAQAGEFKGALKALLPDKGVPGDRVHGDVAAGIADVGAPGGAPGGNAATGAPLALLNQEAAPSAFTGTLDDVRNLIAGGDAGKMGGYAPGDPAFYQKRVNADPAQVPAMLDQLVQEGTLGRLPDGSLGIKPAPSAPLSNVDIPPSITDPAARAAWQARYVGQSRAGTDILAAGDKVAGGDLTQADLNALSPQERMAALRKLAAEPAPAPVAAPVEDWRASAGPDAQELIAGIEAAVSRGAVDEANELVRIAPDFGVPENRAQDILNAAADAGRKGTSVQARIEQIEQSPYFRAFDYFTTRGELKRVNPTNGRPIAGIRQGGEEIWNLPGSGYDEVAAGILSSPEFGNNQNFGMTSDDFWRNARDTIREYWRLKKPRATLGGGDIAAGGGGFGIVPARLGTTLAGAGVGTGIGGLAGGGLGLAAGHEGDQLREDVAAGAGLGALAGGSVGSAAPELAPAAAHLATEVGAKFGDTGLDPGMWADAITVGWRNFQDVRATAGVKAPKEVFDAFWAQWRSQVVNTVKQVPQDALTRKFVQEGIARKEFGLTDGDIRAFQGVLRRERAGGVSGLDNPLTARLRALGASGALADMQGVYGVDFGTDLSQQATKQFGGAGRAAAGALIGLGSGVNTINPISPVYGAARGYAAPFVDGMIRFVNGIQHDAFRYALATKALDRDIPRLANDFLGDLAARGVNVKPLEAKAGYFSPDEVSALAGAQAGKDWATLIEATIRAQGNRIAFLAGDFRKSSETGAERAIGKAVPFARWSIRYAPVLAEIAARHPVATMYVLREMDREQEQARAAGKQAYQAGITISDRTPLVGLAARVRNGGQAGTLTMDPLGALVPYGDVMGGGSALPDDATGYQRATDLVGRVGFQPNPAIQAAAYVVGQGRAPGALSRTAGLEGLGDTLPVLARAGLRLSGNPDLADRVPDLTLPGGRTILDAARGVVAPAVEAAGLPTTGGGPSDPAERRYAEIVLLRTGKPLSDPSNRGLLETMGSTDNPLWQLAILQSRAAGAAGNAASMTSPVQTTAQTSAAAAAQAAPKLPYTSYQISQAPKAAQPAMLAANAAAARANPASATYANISGKARKDQLIDQWEREHLALKRVSPTYYAQALKTYKASLR